MKAFRSGPIGCPLTKPDYDFGPQDPPDFSLCRDDCEWLYEWKRPCGYDGLKNLERIIEEGKQVQKLH